MPDEDIAPLVRELLADPLSRLVALQDRGAIDGTRAEIRELPPGAGGVA